MNLQPILRALPLAAALLLGGCAPRPPAWEGLTQTAGGGSPARAWRSTDARCRITTPFQHLSCRAVVVRTAAGGTRFALLTDEGPALLTLIHDGGTELTIERAHPDLRAQAATFARLVHQAWGVQPGDGKPVSPGVETCADAQRWYDGDPLLLRRVEGQGPSLVIGDYRWSEHGLLAHRARLEAPGISIELRLGTITWLAR